MSSEAIEAAKLRLATAKKWHASASRTLEFAKFRVKSAESELGLSHKEVEEAWSYLLSLDKRLRLTDNAPGMMEDANYVEGDDSLSSGGVGTDDDDHVSTTDPIGKIMKIFVSGCTDGNGNLTLKVQPSDTIASVKTMIQAKLNIPPKHFYLTYAGKFLEDIGTVADYKIQKEETVQFYLRRR